MKTEHTLRNWGDTTMRYCAWGIALPFCAGYLKAVFADVHTLLPLIFTDVTMKHARRVSAVSLHFSMPRVHMDCNQNLQGSLRHL